MNWGMMEILSPSTYYSCLSSSPATTTNWLITSSSSSDHHTTTTATNPTATTKWTQAENKAFENALALYDNLEAPDRWEKVAAAIPGKTVKDVIRQYKALELDVSQIEAGFADIEVESGGVVVDVYNNNINNNNNNNGYGSGNSGGFTLEWVNGYDGGYGYSCNRQGGGGKRGGTRGGEHERKKGVPWTEEEHKLFLMGLKKYGKGDWRNIARNFVVTRTPTQVASHAQKYFIRQCSGGKDKRRASIHDITTSTLDNETTVLTTTTAATATTSSSSPPENHHHSPAALLHHQMAMATATTTNSVAGFAWQQNGIVGYNSMIRGNGNGYVSSPYGGVNSNNNNNPYAVKIEQGEQHSVAGGGGGVYNNNNNNNNMGYNQQHMGPGQSAAQVGAWLNGCG